MDFSEFKTKYNIVLDEQQEKAARTVDGPVLILAVPGSGKTTVLITRLGYMVTACGIEPENILTMTYTVAATVDMRNRFAETFGSEIASRMDFRTINSLANSVIRKYESVYRKRSLELLSDNKEQSSIISQICLATTGEYASESTVKSVASAITYAKNMMLSEEEIAKIKVEDIAFGEVYRAYNETLTERRMMDFDDQLVFAHKILSENKDILSYFAEKYKYICVDEAQDTSKIQHFIIRLLAGKSKNLFMVGDEDQSIYGFRAAYPDALNNFEKTYKNAVVLFIEQNYRSTERVVELANRFIQNSENRRKKQINSTREGGKPVKEVLAPSRYGQFVYLAKVAEEVTSETAVLYRDNDSAIPLIDLLDRNHVGYRIKQAEATFFTHRSVLDVCDVIRFAFNRSDGDAFMRVYYKLYLGINKPYAENIARTAKNKKVSVLDLLVNSPYTSSWTKKRCVAVRACLDKLTGDKASAAIERIMVELKYSKYLKEHNIDGGRVEILKMLGNSEPDAKHLVARIEALKKIVELGSSDENAKFILSTIHSSKGLEYERVILLDVVDGILPKAVPDSKSEESEIAEYQEERRVFYVGMTRAKDELVLLRFPKTLCTTFADELFGKRYVERKAVVDRGDEKAAFDVGVKVEHAKFGAGEIVGKDGDLIKVVFQSGETKNLNLEILLEKNLIKTV